VYTTGIRLSRNELEEEIHSKPIRSRNKKVKEATTLTARCGSRVLIQPSHRAQKKQEKE
jgi:hypothetical protein